MCNPPGDKGFPYSFRGSLSDRRTGFKGYIRPQVKLELGSLTDQRPARTHRVASWVAEEFPEAFKDPCLEVVALAAERSFWEEDSV